MLLAASTLEFYLMWFCTPITPGYTACYITSYYGNTIGIDSVGGVFPLFLSTMSLLALVTYTRQTADNRRIACYGLFTVVFGIATTIEYAVAGLLYGGTLAVSKWWLLATYAGAFAVQRISFKGENRVTSVLLLSVSWTFAMLLSDGIRIVARTVNASPQIIGAGGMYDAVFLGWLIASAILAAAAGFYTPTMVKKLLRSRHGTTSSKEPPQLLSGAHTRFGRFE